MLLLAAASIAAQEPAAIDVNRLGPQIGERVPDFSGIDHTGRARTLASVMGDRGAMIVFFRSADWCPYCRTQLVELQARVADLRKRGLGLVAISYDTPDTLKRFAAARGVTFPLIADAGSAIIKRYGLLNTTLDPATRFYGVPFPGTLIVDRNGVVRERFFEAAYQERNSVASILAREGTTPFGPAMTVETPHLMLTAAMSDDRLVAGRRTSIVFEVEPGRGMHVYAPGTHTYQVVRAAIDPQPWLRVHTMRYPPPELYHFKPLDERVEVYQKPFRLVQDVTVLATREAQRMLEGRTSLTITGRFEYQACDDRLCYTPQSVPVRWAVAFGPLEHS